MKPVRHDIDILAVGLAGGIRNVAKNSTLRHRTLVPRPDDSLQVYQGHVGAVVVPDRSRPLRKDLASSNLCQVRQRRMIAVGGPPDLPVPLSDVEMADPILFPIGTGIGAAGNGRGKNTGIPAAIITAASEVIDRN